MDNRSNLKSYDNVEKLERFSDESFKQYIEQKLRDAKTDADFIASYILPNIKKKKIVACEIGSGNGKLMYLLEKMDVLKYGINYEVSMSRHLFSERVKSYLNSKVVKNYNEDVLSSDDKNCYDLIVAVDLVTQFITCLYESAEEDYFNWINTHLNKGGYAFFEVESYDKELLQIKNNHGSIRTWEEFSYEDPFQYGLYNIDLDSYNNLVYEKLFYERATGKIEGFKQIVKPYTKDSFLNILNKYGFVGEIYDCYDNPGDLDEGVYLCVAKKI